MNPPVFAGRRRPLFAALVLTGLGQAACAGFMASLVRQLFDVATPTDGRLADHGLLLGGLPAVAAGAALLVAIQRTLEEMLGQDFASDLRLALFERAMIDGGPVESGGQGASRLLPFVGDLSAHRRWVGAGIGRLTVGAVASAGLLVVIAIQSPTMAAAVGAVQVCGAVAAACLSRPLGLANLDLRRRRAALSAFIGSRLAAATAVRSMGGLAREMAKVSRRGREMTAAAIRRAALSGGARSLATLVGTTMGLAAILVGVVEVSAGTMSVGGVVGVLGLIGIMSTAVVDLGQAFELWHAAQAASVSAERRPSPDAPPQQPAPPRRRRQGESAVSLERLRLSAEDRAFDAQLSAGEHVLITGQDPGNLHHLMSILGGGAAPAGGCVRMNGRDVRSLAPARLRRDIGVASPALGILRGSLAMNLRYRARRAADAELIDAAELCGLAPLIQRLPGGLAGNVGDGGSRLTMAERHGLIIARAMVGRPPLLVLDLVDAPIPEVSAMGIAATLAEWPGVVLLATERQAWRSLANRTWTLGRRGLRDTAVATVSRLEHTMEVAPCRS